MLVSGGVQAPSDKLRSSYLVMSEVDCEYPFDEDRSVVIDGAAGNDSS